MAIIDSTDAQDIRYEIFPTLTAEEIPDAVITRRTILRNANRVILNKVGLTETQFNALASNAAEREACEEAAIKMCAHDLLPTIAQIVRDNENGILSQYQEISWEERRAILEKEIAALLKPYITEDVIDAGDYPYAVSRTKEE